MKAIVFTLLFMSIFSIELDGQTVFQNTSIGNNDFLFSTVNKDASGLLSLGYSNRFGAGEFDFYLINMDKDGVILWSKSYGGKRTDLGYSVAQAQDDGFVLAGASQSFGMGGADVLFIKIDPDGEVVWSKTYGGSGWDEAYEVTPTADGGYVLAGRTNSFGSGDGDAYCVKVNSFGDELWSRTYGGVNNEDAQQIKQTADSGFIIVGHTQSFGAGNADVYLVKTDAAGNVEWTKTYGGPNYDYGNSVQQTADGGYIVSGQTNSFGFNNGEVLLLKVDESGTVLWSRTYGGSNVDYSHYVIQNPAGGFTITGQTNSFGGGGFDAFILNVDAAGSPLWARSYGGSEDDFSNAIEYVSSENNFFIVGNSLSFGSQSRAYLVKTDSMGNSGCNEFSIAMNVGTPVLLSGTGGFTSSGSSTSDPIIEVTADAVSNNLLCTPTTITEQRGDLKYEVFPNPFSDKAILKTSSLKPGYATLLLYKISGELVEEKTIFLTSQIEIERNNLASGLYIFKLTSEGNEMITGKVIIQ